MRTNKLALTLVLAGAAALPAFARAQASASIQLNLGLPVVMPQMVVVQPGIRVVPDIEEEVFFTNGYYWCRHDDGWYRTRDVRGGWYYMEPGRVPPGLTRMPPGQYRKWHPMAGRPYRGGPGPGRYAGPARYAPGPVRYEGDHGHGYKPGRGHEDREGGDHEGHGHHGRGHGD